MRILAKIRNQVPITVSNVEFNGCWKSLGIYMKTDTEGVRQQGKRIYEKSEDGKDEVLDRVKELTKNSSQNLEKASENCFGGIFAFLMILP